MKISKCGVGGGQQQKVWTRIKLLYMEQSDSGPHRFRLAYLENITNLGILLYLLYFSEGLKSI